MERNTINGVEYREVQFVAKEETTVQWGVLMHDLADINHDGDQIFGNGAVVPETDDEADDWELGSFGESCFYCDDDGVYHLGYCSPEEEHEAALATVRRRVTDCLELLAPYRFTFTAPDAAGYTELLGGGFAASSDGSLLREGVYYLPDARPLVDAYLPYFMALAEYDGARIEVGAIDYKALVCALRAHPWCFNYTGGVTGVARIVREDWDNLGLVDPPGLDLYGTMMLPCPHVTRYYVDNDCVAVYVDDDGYKAYLPPEAYHVERARLLRKYADRLA